MIKEHSILVLTYWSFDDALIQTYTIPYLRIIKKLSPENITIHLVTMEKNHGNCKLLETFNDPDFKVLPLPYYPFGVKAMAKWFKNLLLLKRFIRKKNINTVHSWCTPAGMIAYLLHKKTGVRFVADSFEPHAEAMVENGTWTKSSTAFKILFRYEKKIARHAEQLIAVAPGMNKYIKEKYNVDRTIFIKPACVDLKTFSSAQVKDKVLISELNLENKLVCVYAGKFGGIYLEKEVFRFSKIAADHWKDKVRFLLLTNESQEKLNSFITEAGISPELFIIRFVPHAEVQRWIGLADFALCPVKPVPTKKYCSPIKTGEYWAMGLPVLITNDISNDSEIIANNNAGYVWKNTNDEEFKNSVRYLDNLFSNEERKAIYLRIRKLAEENRNFKIAKNVYSQIYR